MYNIFKINYYFIICMSNVTILTKIHLSNVVTSYKDLQIIIFFDNNENRIGTLLSL